MRKRILLYTAGMQFVVGLLIIAGSTNAKVDSTSRELGQPESLSPTTNIHFTGRYCAHCHISIPKKGRGAALKNRGNPNILCQCHVNTERSYWHPVDINPAKSRQVKVPAELPLLNGRISCITCHDLYQQCRKRKIRTDTLRGAPFASRSDFCFRCHDKSAYAPLDPHNQTDKKGNILADSCLYCHLEPPTDRASLEALSFIGKLDLLCQRCHMISGSHSGNVKHYGQTPKPKTLLRMKAMEAKHQIILPLDEVGRVTCVTCHNPHAKGVIDPSSPAAKGADIKYRHRLPGNMCVICHNK